jgi:hypothetical protein
MAEEYETRKVTDEGLPFVGPEALESLEQEIGSMSHYLAEYKEGKIRMIAEENPALFGDLFERFEEMKKRYSGQPEIIEVIRKVYTAGIVATYFSLRAQGQLNMELPIRGEGRE